MHYLVELIICYPDHRWDTHIAPCVDADDSDDAGNRAIDAFPTNIETAFIGVYHVETVEGICPHCGETIGDEALSNTTKPKIDTPNQREQAYLLSGGNRCPSCNSLDLKSHTWETDSTGTTLGMSCNDCGHSWQECYKLVGIIE